MEFTSRKLVAVATALTIIIMASAVCIVVILFDIFDSEVPAVSNPERKTVLMANPTDANQLLQSLGRAEAKVYNQPLVGGIVPHHFLASDIIAEFFATLDASKDPELVIIIGPNHRDIGLSSAISAQVSWQTPFGTVHTNQQSMELLRKQGLLSYDLQNFQIEHSIKELIPFVANYFPDAEVLPIVLDYKMTSQHIDQLALALEEIMKEKNAVLIASVDFSHYLSSKQAEVNDYVTESAIASRNYEQIYGLNSDYLDSPQALSVLLKTVDGLGYENYDILQHKNSVEFTGIDVSETTSYFSLVFGKEAFSRTTTIMFGGDVMLSREVNSKMESQGSYSWPFAKIASTTAAADITVVNLESPFSDNGTYYVPTGSFNFNANPQSVEGLVLAGIDLVSLANNHFGNMGVSGMKYTFEVLEQNNIKYIGAGDNFTQAHSGKIINANGKNFGFLAYAYPDSLYIATDNNPGMANMDIDLMKKDVEMLKGQADVIIVQMHAGTEYVAKPTLQQISFAKAAIDAGADLVVGHHPHWVQVTEMYKNKPIFYSLGNLVFDQMWSVETQQGALLEVKFENERIQSARVIPIRIKDYGQATIVEDRTEIRTILERMDLQTDTILFN